MAPGMMKDKMGMMKRMRGGGMMKKMRGGGMMKM